MKIDFEEESKFAKIAQRNKANGSIHRVWKKRDVFKEMYIQYGGPFTNKKDTEMRIHGAYSFIWQSSKQNCDLSWQKKFFKHSLIIFRFVNVK